MRLIVSTVLLLVTLSGCRKMDDVRSYPLRFDTASSRLGYAVPVDIDGDGLPEWILYEPDYIVATEDGGGNIDQVNLPGQIASKLNPVDYDDDGDLEIPVAYRRADSLFLAIIDYENRQGRIAQTFFITEGSSRSINGGKIEWEGRIGQISILPKSKSREKILFVTSYTGRTPSARGMWLFSIEDGRLLHNIKSAGNPVGSNSFAPEPIIIKGETGEYLISLVGAGNNGGRVEETNDSEVFVVRTNLYDGSADFEKIGKFGEYPSIYQADVDGDGDSEMVLSMSTYSTSDQRPGRVRFVRDLGTPEIVASTEVELPFALRALIPFDVNGDKADELIALSATGELLVLDYSLSSTRSLNFHGSQFFRISRILPESKAMFQLITSYDSMILSDHLHALALLKTTSRIFQWSSGRTQFFYSHEIQNGQEFTTAYSVARQPLWLISRFRYFILANMILFVTGVAILGIRSMRNRVLTNSQHMRNETRMLFVSETNTAFIVAKVLHNNYSKTDFSVKEWHTIVGISRKTLERISAKLAEATPTELLWERRLNKAEYLLRNSDYTVSEIAYQVGFKDASHFTRKYKDHFGIAPSTARIKEPCSNH